MVMCGCQSPHSPCAPLGWVLWFLQLQVPISSPPRCEKQGKVAPETGQEEEEKPDTAAQGPSGLMH